MVTMKLFLYFPAEQTDKPLTYHLVKDYDLVFNILHAEIRPGMLGKLTIELSGEEENVNKGLQFLAENNVTYTEFNRNIIWNEETCVHCGTCTAVCPTEALSLDKETWQLTFDKSKCVVCEECVKTCPVFAFDLDTFGG